MGSNFNADIRVGLFVALGLILLLGTILALGGEKSIFKNYYTARVKLNQVQGLATGSVVSLAGMPVGNVSSIDFNSDGQSLVVELAIDKEYFSRITDESTAGVRTQGALGDKYIYITPGPIGGKPVAEGGYIKAESSPDLIDIISEKGPQLANIVDVINELKILLKTINSENRSAQLMNNLVASTETLNQMLVDLRGASAKDSQLRDTVHRLSNIVKKIDQGEGTLGALINDPSLHDRLMKMLGESPRSKYLKPLIRATIQEQDGKRQ